jgi:hypothetical protein
MRTGRIDQLLGRGSGSSCRAQENPVAVTAAATSQMITPTAKVIGPPEPADRHRPLARRKRSVGHQLQPLVVPQLEQT